MEQAIRREPLYTYPEFFRVAKSSLYHLQLDNIPVTGLYGTSNLSQDCSKKICKTTALAM